MKISEILTEAEISPYSKEEHSDKVGKVIALLEQHCSQALQTMQDSPLWRGSRTNTANVIVLDPSTGIRKSQNTTNQYTELMDNSPYMKGWPKRSNSLVCTTNKGYASYFGTVYAIFPFDETNIAVCPGKDLWDSQIYIRDFNLVGSSAFGGHELIKWDEINYLLKGLGITGSTYQEIIDGTKSETFAKNLYNMQKNKDSEKIEPEEFIPWLWKRMSPDSVGFDLIPVSEWDSADYPDNECWFSNKCIAIKQPVFNLLW